MEESGRSVETEMISSSDLVYVVTSVIGYHPVTPNLHGIYTTCKGAQDGARRAFAKESSSYRDGKFLPNDERIAKCDTTDFLVPGVTFNSRVMFELFDEDALIMGYTSVAVTAIPIDQTTSCTAKLPCLGASIERAPYLGKKINANPLLVGGTEISAIFTHFDDGVFLAGVYTKRDDAIARGLTYAKFYDEEVEKEQIEDALAVSRGSLFRDEEYSEWEVAIETTLLDRDALIALFIMIGSYLCISNRCTRIRTV